MTHFPLLKALGWALFDSLWQMAALWVLYILLLAIFHTSAARMRHSLALIFLSIGALSTLATFLAAALFPGSGNSDWMSALSPARSTPGWLQQTSRSFMDLVLAYGSTLYLLTISGLLIRHCSHYWHTRNLTRKGVTLLPAEFRVFVQATAHQLNIRKPVRTWLSSLIDVPLTLGFLKPVILLPAAMISQLTPGQVEAVLLHELGHIQRKDYLTHLLVTLLDGLFFFNPFSRLLIRELKKEREHCCDDLVLQFNYDPHAYVSALLALAARQQPGHRLAVAATGSSDKLLLERARRILLQQEGNRSRPGIRSLVFLLFTGLITALALYHPLHFTRRLAPATPSPVTRAFPSVSTVAALETTYSRQIHSTPPATSGHRHLPVRPQSHLSQRPARPQADDNDIFVNTAEDVPGDANTTVMASSNEWTDPRLNASGADNRDYSLSVPGTIAGPAISLDQGTPVVPNSSFSFQYTQDDSTRPEEQLIYLQETALSNVMGAIAQLQQETEAQLKTLAALQTKAAESVRLRRQIQMQRQKLQQEYLKKIAGWQKKLETTTHIRLIVYI